MIALRSPPMKTLAHIAGNARISEMSPAKVRAEWYSTHAAECHEFARQALSHDDKAILESTAAVWRRLAELVERFELA